MRFVKFAAFLLAAALITNSALAQDEVIARAYRTVNVRSGPGTQYDIIGQLNSGNAVPITGRSDDESDWLRIDFQGSEGWVAFFTVTVLGNTEQLSVVVPLIEQPQVRVVATPMLLHAASDLFVTAYRRVNVRSGPGSDYVSVGNLEAGSTADVTGKSQDDEWLRIDYGGKSGWVAFFVVSFSGSLDAVAVAAASAGAATEEPQNTVQIVTRYNINLHEKPTLESPVVDIVPFNTTLLATARSDETGAWLEVSYSGNNGWLIRTLITVNDDLGILPISAPQ